MTLNIQTVHFDADNKLVDYINHKLQKLITFNGRIIKVHNAGVNDNATNAEIKTDTAMVIANCWYNLP